MTNSGVNLPPLNYQFQQPTLLINALTHSSNSSTNYERLEFLGDAVLGLVISHALYRHYQDDQEGDLARKRSLIVSKPSLVDVAAKLHLSDYVIIADGSREAEKHNPSIIADVMEAIIGAVYLDGGYKAAELFVMELFGELVTTLPETPIDARSELQEWAQQRGFDIPSYRVINQTGEAHAPNFTVEVAIRELNVKASSEAIAKKIAYAKAAAKLLAQLKSKNQ